MPSFALTPSPPMVTPLPRRYCACWVTKRAKKPEATRLPTTSRMRVRERRRPEASVVSILDARSTVFCATAGFSPRK